MNPKRPCLAVVICEGTSLLQDEFQLVNTNIRKPKVHLRMGGDTVLGIHPSEMQIPVPCLGQLYYSSRAKKALSFSPCYPLPEKSQFQHGVSLRLIVLSLFQLPISKLANSMFTSSVPKSVTQNFHV